MEIRTPDNTREVIDITYTWNAGMTLDLRIDEMQGDYVKDAGESLHIHLSGKPSPNNPDVMSGAEDIVIYKSTLANIISRTVTLRKATPEEMKSLQSFYNQHPTVQ